MTNNYNISLFLQIDNSLNSLTQFTQFMQNVLIYNSAIFYANVVAVMENFVISKEINYAYMVLSQNKFILSNSSIAVNISKCEKTLYFLYKSKKAPYSSFYENEWFLDSGTSAHFTPFESNFVDMTLDNYG